MQYKLKNLRKAIETVNSNLLDEVITEGKSRYTYSYHPDGKRKEEKIYSWNDNKWILTGTRKSTYIYDEQQRCIERTITENDVEISKVEISYQDGNIFHKYYEKKDNEKLTLTYEEGYDAENNEILNKEYDTDGNLRTWNEARYDKNQEKIFSIYWTSNGDEVNYASKYEKVVEGTKTIDKNYGWDAEKNDWILYSTTTIVSNEAGRNLCFEYIIYNKDNSIKERAETTNSYDPYNRIISKLYEEYSNEILECSYKETYTYWGTEHYEISDINNYEGPLLTYSHSEWQDGQWIENESTKIERNEQGVAIRNNVIEINEEPIDGERFIDKTEGTYDNKGNLILALGEHYHEDGTLMYYQKYELEYDNQNREISNTFYTKSLNSETWTFVYENKYEYDSHNRITSSSYRSFEEYNTIQKWNGIKHVYKYQFPDGESKYVERTSYEMSSSGEFYQTPDLFYSNLLKDGQVTETINLSYYRWGMEPDIYGYGTKEETGSKNILIEHFNPEHYHDGIGPDKYDIRISGINYHAIYKTNRDNSWQLEEKSEIKEEKNQIAITEINSYKSEKYIYTFDDNKRMTGYAYYRDDMKFVDITYEYDNEGLLTKKDEQGVVTLYKYSKHGTGTGIKENTVSILQINNRTITAADSSTNLQVYSTNGTLVAQGTGTVVLSSGGTYIIIADTIRQKINIR